MTTNEDTKGSGHIHPMPPTSSVGLVIIHRPRNACIPKLSKIIKKILMHI